MLAWTAPRQGCWPDRLLCVRPASCSSHTALPCAPLQAQTAGRQWQCRRGGAAERGSVAVRQVSRLQSVWQTKTNHAIQREPTQEVSVASPAHGSVASRACVVANSASAAVWCRTGSKGTCLECSRKATEKTYTCRYVLREDPLHSRPF